MKLALLDRDGVINHDRPDSVRSREEFSLLPRAADAIRLLNKAEIPVVIVTNQAVVGRGDLSAEGLADIHSHLEILLKKEGASINHILTCPSPDPSHPDRKPNPGLLLKALKLFHVKQFDAVMIGDALRDLEAAADLGCPRALVCTGKGKATLEEGLPPRVLPVTVYEDLYHAVTHLLGREG